MSELQEKKAYFWATSEDSEYWAGNFDSIEAAIADAVASEDEEVGDYIYIGVGEPTDPAEAISADHIFENWADMNPECAPMEESWQGFWGLSGGEMDELTTILRQAFYKFAESHKLRVWHTVMNAEKHEIPKVQP